MLNENCGVYLIISPSNGRYVGSSKSLKKRFSRYKNYSCSRQSAILASLKKYGYENHKVKVLMYCEEKELYFWERVFGDIYLALAEHPNGLNLTLPGYEDVPQVRSEEFKKRVSEIQKKRFENSEQRNNISIKSKKALENPEVRKKISDSQKKRFANPEKKAAYIEQRKDYYKNNTDAINRLSEIAKEANKNSEIKEKRLSGLRKYYLENPNIRSERMKEWHKTNPNYKNQGQKLKENYKNNLELKKILSEKAKIQFANPENNVRSKKVINIETGEIFSCINYLAKKLGKNRKTVSKWLNNQSNQSPYRYAN